MGIYCGMPYFVCCSALFLCSRVSFSPLDFYVAIHTTTLKEKEKSGKIIGWTKNLHSDAYNDIEDNSAKRSNGKYVRISQTFRFVRTFERCK